MAFNFIELSSIGQSDEFVENDRVSESLMFTVRDDFSDKGGSVSCFLSNTCCGESNLSIPVDPSNKTIESVPQIKRGPSSFLPICKKYFSESRIDRQEKPNFALKINPIKSSYQSKCSIHPTNLNPLINSTSTTSTNHLVKVKLEKLAQPCSSSPIEQMDDWTFQGKQSENDVDESQFPHFGFESDQESNSNDSESSETSREREGVDTEHMIDTNVDLGEIMKQDSPFMRYLAMRAKSSKTPFHTHCQMEEKESKV